MFVAWRTQLREAQQASELGRLDEAAQRLTEHQLTQYKPGEDFARQLATSYLGRATRRAEEGNFAGANHDLQQAKLLAGATEAWSAAQARVGKLAKDRFAPPTKQPPIVAMAESKPASISIPPPSTPPVWPMTRSETSTPRAQENAGVRFMLWVDAVGGFLVCLSDEIWIGQATIGNPIAVPIQAELSRKHAKLMRSGEGYVLEAAHPTSVNGHAISGKHLLADGDEMELGRGVRLRFRQPHSLSASARLEVVSRHRTQPYCDTVILMAESCVLGSKWQDHVICKDWENDVVLFRQGTELHCRSAEPLSIDGVYYERRGPLTPNSRVAGEDYAFSLELL